MGGIDRESRAVGLEQGLLGDPGASQPLMLVPPTQECRVVRMQHIVGVQSALDLVNMRDIDAERTRMRPDCREEIAPGLAERDRDGSVTMASPRHSMVVGTAPRTVPPNSNVPRPTHVDHVSDQLVVTATAWPGVPPQRHP